MSNSAISGQNVDEQGFYNNKSTNSKRDSIKKSVNTMIDNSINGLDGDTLIKILELLLNNPKEINIENLENEIESKLSLFEKTEKKNNILNKNEFLTFFKKDLEIFKNIDLLKYSLNFLMNCETEECEVNRVFLNLKIYLDEYIGFSRRLEKIERRPNTQPGISTPGVKFGNFEKVKIKYDFSYEQKNQILDWIDELKKSNF